MRNNFVEGVDRPWGQVDVVMDLRNGTSAEKKKTLRIIGSMGESAASTLGSFDLHCRPFIVLILFRVPVKCSGSKTRCS